MSRKSSRSRRNRRDNVSIANRRLPYFSSSPRSMSQLSLIEDRRVYNPLGSLSPARSISRNTHALVVPNDRVSPSRSRSNRSFLSPPSFVGFQAPKKVLVCVRRQRRKEVLHALKKTGRVGQRRPRFSDYSSIKCV